MRKNPLVVQCKVELESTVASLRQGPKRRPCKKVLAVLMRVGRVPEQLRGNFSGLQERTMTTVISRQVRRKSGMK